MNYYNEWDKDAAAWLRELIKAGLIPAGEVDERSITEVKAHELTSYTQAHFFAGIGGWPLAFQLAGVQANEPADTGSCPCQPFSQTGKQMGFSDSRHLWPAFRRLENRRRAPVIYGEQVASKLGREWLSRVFSDLEIMGYAGSGADLCSAGVGSPNIRQRLYWVGDSVCERRGERSGQYREVAGARSRKSEPSVASGPVGVEYATGDGRQQRGTESNGGSAGGRSTDGMAISDSRKCDGVTDRQGRERHGPETGWEQGDGQSESSGASERMADTKCIGLRGRGFGADGGAADGVQRENGERERFRAYPWASGPAVGSRMGHTHHPRPQGRIIRWDSGRERASGEAGVADAARFWDVAELVYCRDEKVAAY